MRPADAAVSALALTTGLLPGHGGRVGELPDADLLAATAPVRWLVAAVTEHLAWARERDAIAASLTQSSLNAGYVGGF
jgi:hypothetical protein